MIPNQSYCFSGIVITLYFFFLFSFVLHTLASPTIQRDALLEFKHEFPVNESDPRANYMSSWNKSSDYCSWEGVTCDDGKVTSLSLDYTPLNNSLKPNSGLFKLQYLQNISLSYCNLSGEIPSSLGNLSHLIVLHLSNNELVGQIPDSIGNLTQLRYLRLSQNSLSGKIPVSIGNLTQLRDLNLRNNYLESELPPDMSRLHNLEAFDVNGNSLIGHFPTSLLTISSLQWVLLAQNKFKGPIEFGNTSLSSSLFGLLLSNNKFEGAIPESISKFLNLKMLYLSDNNFLGPIPRSMSQLVNLSFLDLSNNKLEGKVPSFVWRLDVLMLSHNSFSSFGNTSVAIDQSAQMGELGLDSNLFRGSFPRWICKFSSLNLLDFSNNSFSGSLPQCFKNITNSLQVLNLRNNNFSGTVPDMFVNATSLRAVDVSRNRFEGKLPKSLISCKALELLNVGRNKFEDIFPSLLGSLPSLNVLILQSNQFYGPLYHHHVSIGFQNLKVIDVSQNDFNGTFPGSYFSNCREMTTTKALIDGTYMEDVMEYTGNYRSSLEMVHKGVDTMFEGIRKDFIAIDFSENKFSGNIPESIGLLKELRLLNLSGNAFTSNIPQSLANLTNLEALDLSRNQLVGQIPRDLGTLNFLSSMNFSHNNLNGPIPRGTQFQRQDCSSFIDNHRLYGLEEICGNSHVLNPTQQDQPDELMEHDEEVILTGSRRQ